MSLTDELRYEYAEGRLVPFLGSGMSRPVCSGWLDLVSGLEKVASRAVGVDHVPLPENVDETDDLGLTRRAARALEQLRRQGGEQRAVAAVREALLVSATAEPPSSTTKLASLDWPLVLTTNYDDLYAAAVHQRFLHQRIGARPLTDDAERRTPPIEVVGRSPADCHRVLSALRRPAGPLLWALQGFLPGQAQITTRDAHGVTRREVWADYVSAGSGMLRFSGPELERQLVVGHAEYRAVTMRSESFRRAFAEVCRSRSLFFLGSGMRDRYLLDLFSQIAELYGPSTQHHYAIVPRGVVDTMFMRRYFGIWAIEIANYDEIPEILGEVGSPANVSVGANRWSYSVRPAGGRSATPLTVCAAPLTSRSTSSECVVVSGGGSGGWVRLSRGIRSFLIDTGLLPKAFRDSSNEVVGRCFRPVSGRRFTWMLKAEHRGREDGPTLLVARARLDAASALGRQLRPVAPAADPLGRRDRAGRVWRDLRLIKPVMAEVIDVAVEAGHGTVVSTLLASGSLRSFPSSFVLQEMIRAWVQTNHDAVGLELHVTEDAILTDLRSGRLDVAYLLPRSEPGAGGGSSQRFWLEIVEGASIERIPELRESSHGVRALLEEYWLDRHKWVFDVLPRPCLEWSPWDLEAIQAWESETGSTMSLERLGVINGSTLVALERPRR